MYVSTFSSFNFMIIDVQIEDISNIICYIYHHYIQQYHDERFRHLMLALLIMDV